MQHKQENINLDLKANDFFNLKRFELLELKYKLNENFNKDDVAFSIKTTLRVDKYENEGEVTFCMDIFQELKDNETPYKIKISMKGYYEWSDIEENKLNKYLRINAPAVLLSYMRPLIAQVTMYTKYSPLILPLLNFSKATEIKKDN